MLRLVFLLSSAALLILSYPPFDLGWLAWIAVVPWLMRVSRVTPVQSFRESYLLGLLFFGGTVWWIGIVTVPGVILLVAFLALYFALWGWWANRLLVVPRGLWPLFVLPAFWVVLEYLRSILPTGFGWNLLGHTQWHCIPLIQIANLAGVYGVSFFVVFVNVGIYDLLRQGGKKRNQILLRLGLIVFCIAAALSYGIGSLATASLRLHRESSSFKVAVVQGNIPQYQKWDQAFEEMIWNRYKDLTREAVQARPDLLIWPETSVPNYLDDPAVYEKVERIARSAATWFLTGAPVSEFHVSTVFNSAVLFDPTGDFSERYDKIHLVPFGEYLPLEQVLGWLRKIVLMGNFSPGRHFTVFRPTTVPSFSVLICFEDLFPSLCRRFVQQGAQWLIVITNDAWFLKSAASVQHLQASVFRAVENRMWVARAANTGWSGFIDPRGIPLASLSQVPRFESGFAIAPLTIISQPTLYTRWGDWFVFLCLLICLLFLGSALFPSRKPV